MEVHNDIQIYSPRLYGRSPRIRRRPNEGRSGDAVLRRTHGLPAAASRLSPCWFQSRTRRRIEQQSPANRNGWQGSGLWVRTENLSNDSAIHLTAKCPEPPGAVLLTGAALKPTIPPPCLQASRPLGQSIQIVIAARPSPCHVAASRVMASRAPRQCPQHRSGRPKPPRLLRHRPSPFAALRQPLRTWEKQ